MADKTIGSILVALGIDLKDFKKGLDAAKRDLSSIQKDFSAIGKTLTGAFTLPLAGMGLAVGKAALDFDSAFAKIKRQTGATGDELKSLENSFQKLFRTGDDSAAEVANALALLRSKTGETGESLESLTSTVLDLSDVTGEDLNALVGTSTRLFGDWSVATEGQSTALDFLFTVSQKTGVSFTKLSDTLIQFGAPLRNLGFDLERSAALIAKFDKEGVNTETVLSAMKTALGKFSDKGLDPAAAFRELVKQIKNTDEATGNLLAKEATNTKVFIDFATAVREGKFELDGLLNSTRDYSGAIAKTAAESETLTQKFTKIQNALTDAVKPFADAIVGKLEVVMPAIAEGIGAIASAIRSIPAEAIKVLLVFFAGLAGSGPIALGVAAVAGSLANMIGIVRNLTLAVGSGSLGALSAGSLAFSLSTVTGLLTAGAAAWVLWGDQAKGAAQKALDYLTPAIVKLAEVAKPIVPQAVLDYDKKQTAERLQTKRVKENTDKLIESLGGIDKVSEKWNGFKEIVGAKLQAATGLSILATNKQAEAIKSAGKESETATPGFIDFAEVLGGTVKKKADEAAQAVKGLKDNLESLKLNDAASSLKEQLDQALSDGNFAAIGGLQERYKEALAAAILDGFKDAIEKGGKAAEAEVNKTIAYQKEQTQKQIYQDGGKALTTNLKKNYADAISFWRSSFQNAVTGETFNLKDQLDQVAVGFAASIAASFGGNKSGGFLGVKSPQDLGQKIAENLFGVNADGLVDLPNGLSDLFNRLFEQKDADGNVIPGILDKLISDSPQFGNAVYAAPYVLDSVKKLQSDTATAIRGGFAAVGAVIGAVYLGEALGPAGAAIGAAAGDALGQAVNSGFGIGKKEAGDKAREDLTGAIEELVGTIQFFNQQGQLVQTNNLLSGNDTIDFATPGWADSFNQQFSGQQISAFTGIANAFEELLGIEKDVGNQVGASLLQQFSGDIEGLKALVDVAKLSYDDFVNFLVESGKKGEATWLEIISQVNAAGEVFADGLTGSGEFILAFENILNSGGKGQLALNQIKNIAIEAGEAGITTLEGLREQLIASGKFSQDEINALFEAFRVNNITNLDQIAGLSDLQLGSIVASIDASLQDHGAKWREAQADAELYAKTLDEKINGKQLNVTINVKTKFDSNTEDVIDAGIVSSQDVNLNTGKTIGFASGGILNGPTWVRPGALAGEAGPEAILPLKNVNGRLGVAAVGGGGMGGVTVNIDARGAQRGVEQEIIAALGDLERSIMSQVVEVVSDGMSRGAF